MDKGEYARIAAVEDEHWWYRSMRELLADLLGPWLGSDQAILDAGCGPGGNGAWLNTHGHVVGLDLAPEALRLLSERRPEVAPVLGSITELPFPASTFDVVLEVTVACLVAEDLRALRELARVLRPGAAIALVEPAFETLRREHDRTVHGLRRYRRRSLEALVKEAGLRVERSTYAFTFLAPVALVLALVDRIRSRAAGETDSDVEKRALDSLFGPLAALERRWLARHRLPFGTSVVVVATRPSS